MIDAKAKSKYYRTAKERVRKYVMEPAGFTKGEHLYVRATGDQIHGIGFQPNRYGGSYFVNVAFHYCFLPAFLAGRNSSAAEFHPLDFLLLARLEDCLGPRSTDNQPEWPYGNSAEETEYFLARNARKAIAAIDVYSRRWSDPRIFLELATPELIVSELNAFEDFERRRLLEAALPFEERGHPLHDAIGREWGIRVFSFTFALASIALRSGLIALAKEYNDILIDVAESRQDAALADVLAARITGVS